MEVIEFSMFLNHKLKALDSCSVLTSDSSLMTIRDPSPGNEPKTFSLA